MEMVLAQRHTGVLDLAELRERTRIAIQAALGKSEALLKLFEMTHDAEIALPGAVIAHLSRAHDLTREQGKAWAMAFSLEMEETGWGIINGLTRAAQKYQGDKRLEMESLAGDLIAPSLAATKDVVVGRWDVISRMARQLQMEEPKLVQSYVGSFQ